VNTSYGAGGAAVAVANLHRALLAEGVDSRVLVAEQSGAVDPRVLVLPKRAQGIERYTHAVAVRAGLGNSGILSTFALPRMQAFREADVLNFHNLHGGYFNFLALPRLTRLKPSVLTLHDMWTFTGHCVYSYDCDRWRSGCGSCPYPESYPAIRRDATGLEHWLKAGAFDRSRLRVVAISRWMETLARDSLLGRLPIHYIPNGIDLQAFSPRNSGDSRAALGLPPARPVILFVAHHLHDRRKGFDLLVDALARLPEALRRNALLAVLGEAGPGTFDAVPIEVRAFGYVADEELKARVYSASDVIACPTRADNLPLVLQEAMACGLPIVSFAVGGVVDLVRDGATGFAARPEVAEDFASRLQVLLENAALRESMRKACREVAVSEYDVRVQAHRYQALFEEVRAERWEGAPAT
jgi:glycosyltransferase involved in cell wall biosynthesis